MNNSRFQPGAPSRKISLIDPNPDSKRNFCILLQRFFSCDVPVDALHTQSAFPISIYEQVKEPYPSDHPLNAGKKPLFFIHNEDDAFISLIKSASAMDG